MSLLSKLRELASVQDGDREREAVAVEPDETPEPEETEDKIFREMVAERRAQAVAEDDPMVVVHVTRGKHGGMDYVLRNAHGKELSREPTRRGYR